MNYLAHLFLSRNSEKLMVGNFIADAIKGKKYLMYDSIVAKGIVMHREIDSFTDSHAIISHSKSFFRKRYGLYSSVLIDLFYDHFLAISWKEYSSVPLAVFSLNTYRVLNSHSGIMPSAYHRILFYMERENWLLNYSHIEGTQKSLTGISRRIKNNPGIENSIQELKDNYLTLLNDFKSYFPELIHHLSDLFPTENQQIS